MEYVDICKKSGVVTHVLAVSPDASWTQNIQRSIIIEIYGR